VFWQVPQPGEVYAKTSTGDHVIDIEARSVRTVEYQPDAAAPGLGSPYIRLSEDLDDALHTGP